MNTDGARRSGVATVSFDFCCAKAVPESMVEKDVNAMVSLVMVDSASGYLHSVPLRSKNQWNLMVREFLGFTSILGHSEVVYCCDNEPSLRQLLRMVVNARLGMGLPTRRNISAPYAHNNALVENAIGRIRPLAGTLMHFLSEQVGVEFSTNFPWWSCAFRHASFLLNRFTPTRGATPYEILYQKDYAGSICNFGEPVFGFARVTGKGTAHWRRMVFIGITDPQDTYILFDGHELAPSTPRGSPTTRLHEVEPDEHESKKARVEMAKKQRLDRISAEHASMVRMVKFAEEERHTMDEYDHELGMDDHWNVDEWMHGSQTILLQMESQLSFGQTFQLTSIRQNQKLG
eukprot:s1844_g4.t1